MISHCVDRSSSSLNVVHPHLASASPAVMSEALAAFMAMAVRLMQSRAVLARLLRDEALLGTVPLLRNLRRHDPKELR
jgi:hypothetical protein